MAETMGPGLLVAVPSVVDVECGVYCMCTWIPLGHEDEVKRKISCYIWLLGIGAPFRFATSVFRLGVYSAEHHV